MQLAFVTQAEAAAHLRGECDMELVGFEIRSGFRSRFHCLSCVRSESDAGGWAYKQGGARKASYAIVSAGGSGWRVQVSGSHNPNHNGDIQATHEIVFDIQLWVDYMGLRLPPSRPALLASTTPCHRCKLPLAELRWEFVDPAVPLGGTGWP